MPMPKAWHVTTFAGSGSNGGSGTAGYADGAGNAAKFNAPTDLAISGNTLYVSTLNAGLIRKLEYR